MIFLISYTQLIPSLHFEIISTKPAVYVDIRMQICNIIMIFSNHIHRNVIFTSSLKICLSTIGIVDNNFKK